MRKLLLSFLMATTAAAVTTPALAQRADRQERAEERDERRAKAEKARKERTEAREARPQRAEQPKRAAPAKQQQQNVRVHDQRQDVRQQNVRAREQVRDRRATNVNERGRPTLDQRQQARDQRLQVRDQRQDSRAQAREQRIDSRERYVQQRIQPQRVRPPANARPDRPAPPPPTATTQRAPTWSPTHWRSDRRYDWRNHRDRNRSHFRLGIYFDPFGWNYRRYNVGWRLWPSYYSQNYWLNDPYMYRLPYAPWPYKWVRYYDDALLVNVYSGQVADVIYDFFW